MLVLKFQVGSTRCAMDIRLIHEVVPRVPLQRVEAAPAWLAGLLVYRGRVAPVLDLHQILGAGTCPQLLSSRIILVPYRHDGKETLVGLLAAQVAELREIELDPASLTTLPHSGMIDLGPVAVHEGQLLQLLDLNRALPLAVQRQLAGVAADGGSAYGGILDGPAREGG